MVCLHIITKYIVRFEDVLFRHKFDHFRCWSEADFDKQTTRCRVSEGLTSSMATNKAGYLLQTKTDSTVRKYILTDFKNATLALLLTFCFRKGSSIFI